MPGFRDMSIVKSTIKLAATVLLSSLASHSFGALIYFDPAFETASVGDTVEIDLVWDGTAGPDYIGDYDFDIAYNTSVLAWDGVDQDPESGVDSQGCAGLFSICFDDEPSSGVIDLLQISFDAPLDLIANQNSLGNMFVLATLEFEAIGIGTSLLELSIDSIGDENGADFTPGIRDGEVCVDCTQIPEPGSLALLGLGLLGMTGRRRRGAR